MANNKQHETNNMQHETNNMDRWSTGEVQMKYRWSTDGHAPYTLHTANVSCELYCELLWELRIKCNKTFLPSSARRFSNDICQSITKIKIQNYDPKREAVDYQFVLQQDQYHKHTYNLCKTPPLYKIAISLLISIHYRICFERMLVNTHVGFIIIKTW